MPPRTRRKRNRAHMDTLDTEMDARTFRRISAIVYCQAGIALGERKEALVAARIGKRMRQLGIKRYSEYLRVVEDSPEDGEVVNLINAITTNVTSFFREQPHFDRLATWLARWRDDGQTRFRIWSAASASGEEPYSLAIVARELLPSDADVRILATDISTHALEEAVVGVYDRQDIEPVPAEWARRHFRAEAGGARWRVTPALKALIRFARLNLSQPPYPMRGPFDVIFCRNVMIYFDDAVRIRLLEECWRLLRPGGYLVVGHSESLTGMLSRFRPVEPSIYVKP